MSTTATTAHVAAVAAGPASPPRPRRRASARVTDRRPADNRPASTWAPRGPRNGLKYLDFLCGAGGSSAGLSNAGWDLRFAVNHWPVAIDTHQANFPDVWHECVDVTTINMRKLPRANALWISPICTEASPAGGNGTEWRESEASQRGQGSLFGDHAPVEQAGMEKTRATFWEAVRYAEMWRPELIFLENVPDVARKWALFKKFLFVMEEWYDWYLTNVNSAHIGSSELGIPYAPQWRDRMYITFVRKDIKKVPDVTPRPMSMCFHCREVVEGVQTWCKAQQNNWLKVGRYRRDPNSSYGSYWYTCPRGCRDSKGEPARVEPFILPAVAALDWTDLGQPIADGQLVRNSLRRIAAGQEMFWGEPTLATVRGNTFERGEYARVWSAMRSPSPTLTTDATVGLTLPPFTWIPGGRWPSDPMSVGEPMRTQLANGNGSESIAFPASGQPFMAMYRTNMDATSLGEPMPTLAAGGHHHALVTPPGFQVTHCGGEAKPANLCRPLDEPLGTVVSSGAHHALVLPYYSNDPVYTTDQPIGTLSTRDRYAIVPPGEQLGERDVQAKDGGTVRLKDCRHRMVQWKEAARAQVLPVDDGYIITGTSEERTAQAGNAVSSNAAQWLGLAGAAILQAD